MYVPRLHALLTLHGPFVTYRAAWDGAVAKPLEAASEASRGAAGGTSSGVMLAEWGRQQLLQLLTRIMIRSCKADLALLPPCYKKVGRHVHTAQLHLRVVLG